MPAPQINEETSVLLWIVRHRPASHSRNRLKKNDAQARKNKFARNISSLSANKKLFEHIDRTYSERNTDPSSRSRKAYNLNTTPLITITHFTLACHLKKFDIADVLREFGWDVNPDVDINILELGFNGSHLGEIRTSFLNYSIITGDLALFNYLLNTAKVGLNNHSSDLSSVSSISALDLAQELAGQPGSKQAMFQEMHTALTRGGAVLSNPAKANECFSSIARPVQQSTGPMPVRTPVQPAAAIAGGASSASAMSVSSDSTSSYGYMQQGMHTRDRLVPTNGSSSSSSASGDLPPRYSVVRAEKNSENEAGRRQELILRYTNMMEELERRGEYEDAAMVRSNLAELTSVVREGILEIRQHKINKVLSDFKAEEPELYQQCEPNLLRTARF